MRDRYAAEWEALARRDAYFPLLAADGSAATSAGDPANVVFFESGEADITSLLAAIAALLGHDVPLASALDFGCGAGRLTLPLARRASRVVGCDIAPTMLMHARENAAAAQLQNVSFVDCGELTALPERQFDFICALLVFRYIPPADGYPVIDALLRLLTPGGIAAIQVTLEERGGRLRRLAGMTRSSRSRRGEIPRAESSSALPPYLRRNAYDERIVNRTIEAADARVIGRFPTTDGDGEVVVIEK